MLLKSIISDYKGEYENLNIAGITCDSREVKSGYAFFCIDGVAADGHKFASSAAEKGAAVIIAQKDTGLSNQIILNDTRIAFAKACANWFGNPAGKLKIIGVTGTNGKTSVTYMLKAILEYAGNKVGLIGTIQNMIGGEIIESHNTTPGPYELNTLFMRMVDAGCDYAVMEISSHALHQHRVCDISFDAAIFTNLTQDHLDYHKTMDNYLEAKKMLFKMCKLAIVNSDDSYAKDVVSGLDCNVVTYSASDNSDYSAKGVTFRPASVEYELVSQNGIRHISVNSGGRFTVYNSLAAAVCAIELGINQETVALSLADFTGVKGRCESVPNNFGFTVIIDYSHTPDGLKNIITTFKECDRNRIITVFGCGGDRDKAKRPIMGSIAVHNSDYVIVTSDNPRNEDPMAIIDDILVGTAGCGTPLKVIENRVDAIKYAISIAAEKDIIILAGKGHETYQILKDKTIHLDEREIVAEALKEKGEV